VTVIGDCAQAVPAVAKIKPVAKAIRRLTQLLLGHGDIRSTARYAQLDTTDLAEALHEMQGGSD
jgi:hypothetical protein